MYLKKVPRFFSWFNQDSSLFIKNAYGLFLSFDDGPDPVSTPVILGKLSLLGIKATFFCLGEKIQRHYNLYQKILEEGHLVGNHGFQHLSGWRTSKSRYLENVKKGFECVKSPLYRPPYGRMTRSQTKAIKAQHHIILWNIMPGDFDISKKPKDFNYMNNEKYMPGDIIVLHDKAECLENTIACIEALAVQNREFELFNTYFNMAEETNQDHKSIYSI